MLSPLCANTSYVNTSSDLEGNNNLKTASKNGQVTLIAANNSGLENGEIANVRLKKLNSSAASDISTSYSLNSGSVKGNGALSVSNGSITSIENNNGDLPETYALMQNYPNPFNPSTNISFSLKEGILARLEVYDILGRKVATLLNQFKAAGSYTVSFDASGLANGIYLYKLDAGNFTQTKKMLLMK